MAQVVPVGPSASLSATKGPSTPERGLLAEEAGGGGRCRRAGGGAQRLDEHSASPGLEQTLSIKPLSKKPALKKIIIMKECTFQKTAEKA